MERKIIGSIFVASVLLVLIIPVMGDEQPLLEGEISEYDINAALIASCPQEQVKIIDQHDHKHEAVDLDVRCQKECKQFANGDYYVGRVDGNRWLPLRGSWVHTAYQWMCCCRGEEAFNAAQAEVVNRLG